jgi:hypothetical protein
MRSLTKHPWFVALLLACAAACFVQGWLIYTARERALRGAVLFEAKRGERDRLARQSPALSEENSRAIAADVAAAEKRLAELRAHLAGKAWLPPTPARPVDAYFALAVFNEKMRVLAGHAQVALRTEERFGFSTYANEGPAADLVASVHRQRVVMQHLLEVLFEARPKSLAAAVRERPLTEAQWAARHAGTGNVGASDTDASAASSSVRSEGQQVDFFEPDAGLRLRHAGLVDGELYRVEFTGQTQVLRTFLNVLATSPLPLFVRAVEVEPADAQASVAEGGAPSTAAVVAAPLPLVATSFSKFAVVLECVEVAPRSASSSP